jgi:DNA invertase Pin-like site-specific DNA recombinase
MPIAYAYSRYSSEPQGKGDSIRRQQELIDSYLKHHPELELSTDAALQFTDQGVSAFRGTHAKRGAFSKFLRLVEDGYIPAGSYLLVEQFDRLSRQEPMKALAQLNSLLQEDIIVVTLQDGREYTKEGIAKDGGLSLMMAVMQMVRAHEESRTKGLRVKQAWGQKFKKVDEGVMLTKRLPFWIAADNHKKLNKATAPVIKKIFAKAAKGIGAYTIAKELNEDGVSTPTGRAEYWSTGTVKKLLKSKSTIGILTTGDGVEHAGYFPTVIPEALFYKVNNVAKSNKTVRSAKSNPRGLHPLAGLMFCAKCNKPAHHVSKQGRIKADGTKSVWRYAICAQAMENGGACKYQSLPYDQVVLSVIHAIEKHNYSDAQGDTLAETQLLEGRISLLNAKIDFHDDFKTAVGKRKYQEAIEELDQAQERLRELSESRSPLNARLYKQAKKAVLSSGTDVTNHQLRQLVDRVDLNFDKQTYTVRFHDNGQFKGEVGICD